MPCIKGKLTPQSFMSQMNPIGFFSGFQITVTYFVFAVRPPRSYLNLSDYVHIMDAFCFLMIHTDMDVFPKAGFASFQQECQQQPTFLCPVSIIN